MFKALSVRLRSASALSLFLLSSVAFGQLSVDGEGHYALRGETQTKPGMASDRGIHQAIDQSFRLLGEVRMHDKASFFMELRLFDDPRQAYLGDDSRGELCTTNDNGGRDCVESTPSVREPAYKPYRPFVTKAYARYAFDYCILEAGRRGRQWGLGAFLDAGTKPFSQSPSLYDGLSCDINLQDTQTLGVTFGYDKIGETGGFVAPLVQDRSMKFGANNIHDDVDQFFLSIVYDDRKAKAGSSLTKEIGIYAARISSSNVNKGGSNTDLTFVDLYTSFFYNVMSLKNEILFSLGKSADPHLRTLGGAHEFGGDPATNRTNTISLTGELTWTLASAGSYFGPKEFQQGDASRHLIFGDYAYTPGDAEGYYNDTRSIDVADAKYEALAVKKRAKTATAAAFHPNFKPALIMFNGRPQTDDLRVDGVFDPNRVMNAQVYGLGYRYEDLNLGNFEVKGIFGLLNESMPEDVVAYYKSTTLSQYPVGYFGNTLGLELDLKYWRHLGKDVDLGVAAGALAPGDAWQISASEKPKINYLLQSFIAFHF